MLYDSLLVFALLAATTMPFVAIRGPDREDPSNIWHQLALLVVCYAFFVGFWYRFGRTLGMQAWGLMVERKDGGRPSLGHCSLRFVVAILSLLAAGLGFLWQLIDAEKMTWHDRASGTVLRYRPKRKSGDA